MQLCIRQIFQAEIEVLFVAKAGCQIVNNLVDWLCVFACGINGCAVQCNGGVDAANKLGKAGAFKLGGAGKHIMCKLRRFVHLRVNYNQQIKVSQHFFHAVLICAQCGYIRAIQEKLRYLTSINAG